MFLYYFAYIIPKIRVIVKKTNLNKYILVHNYKIKSVIFCKVTIKKLIRFGLHLFLDGGN